MPTIPILTLLTFLPTAEKLMPDRELSYGTNRRQYKPDKDCGAGFRYVSVSPRLDGKFFKKSIESSRER